jgi:hypothetical protein
MPTFNIDPASLANADLLPAGVVQLSDDQLAAVNGGESGGNRPAPPPPPPPARDTLVRTEETVGIPL